MQIIRFLFFLVFFIPALNAQNDFPASWEGTYRGKLEIYTVDSVRMHLPMELYIGKTARDSVFEWRMGYLFKGKWDYRNYEIRIVDSKRGLYRIDEKNSIRIDAYLHNNRILTSFYEVSGSFIVATYTRYRDKLVFEIISAGTNPVSKTGNSNHENEKIPEVSAFRVSGRQRAVLVKKE